MKLKVCGMREIENISALANFKPDYMGFIFWAPSSRYVESTTPALPNQIKKTGVFVDATPDYIQSTIQDHQLKAVQLHGEETPAYCELIQEFGVEVIKAFSIKDQFDFSLLDSMKTIVIIFFLTPKGNFLVAMAMALTGVLNYILYKTLFFKRRNWPGRL